MNKEASGPSAHSCMTGNFVANASDKGAGHDGGFGTAINVLSKDDCGGWSEKAGAAALVDKYKKNLTTLNLD